jgi:2-polyprenyl-3-methyl-5-hydroxy-6-metoxy-1,4-benzoquinol methylase
MPTTDQHAFWSGRDEQWTAIVGHRPGRLLDVGCGFGHFVHWAQAHGWDAWGCDADPWAREQTVAPGQIVASPEAAPAPFDLITLWDVLEHVPEPMSLSRSLRPLLRSGGRLVVGCPNFVSMQRRWPWLRRDATRFSDTIKPDEHVVQFTGPGLVLTLERAGYVDVQLLHPPLSRRSRPLANELARRCSSLRRGLFASGVAG